MNILLFMVKEVLEKRLSLKSFIIGIAISFRFVSEKPKN